MNKDRVLGTIDNVIRKSLSEGKDFYSIIDFIQQRCKNINRVIDKDNIDVSMLIHVLIGNKDESEIDFSKIPLRAKYAYFYISQADKRISDIKWIMENQSKLEKYSKTDMDLFNLVKFKDKINY